MASNALPPNAAVWFEIPVTDMARAKAFYAAVVGAPLEDQEGGPNPMANFPMASGRSVSGHLYPGKPAARGTIPAPQGTTAKLVIVDVPGSAQTQVRVAGIGVPRATPDFEALEVMNALLGGLFTSRINLNLREDKGYTYGAFSAFVFRKAAGPFFVGAGVRTDATAPSVTEIYNEIRKMKDVQVSTDELALGRDSLVRSMPGRFETTGQAAASFASLFVYDLGLDYYSKYIERVGAVEAAAVHAAAGKHLAPERMLVVAVGDRQKIEAELLKLSLGTAEFRDLEGVVVKP